MTIGTIKIYFWGYEVKIDDQLALWIECGKNIYTLRIPYRLGGKKYYKLASVMMDTIIALGHQAEMPNTKRNKDFLIHHPEYIKYLKNGLFLDIQKNN